MITYTNNVSNNFAHILTAQQFLSQDGLGFTVNGKQKLENYDITLGDSVVTKYKNDTSTSL